MTVCLIENCLHGTTYACIIQEKNIKLIHTCTHTDRQAHMHTNTHAHTYTCTQIHMHTHTHAHTYTCTHIHMHTHTCTHIHMHTHTHAHTYTCTHIHMHTIHSHSHNAFTQCTITCYYLCIEWVWSVPPEEPLGHHWHSPLTRGNQSPSASGSHTTPTATSHAQTQTPSLSECNTRLTRIYYWITTAFSRQVKKSCPDLERSRCNHTHRV